MSEEEKGFKVKDRRMFREDGSENPMAEEAPKADPGPPEDQAENYQAQGAGRQGSHPLPPVDFSSLVISFSHAVLFHLGQIPDPASGEPKVDLDMARHTIDTIAMLKAKTKGNLTDEEAKLITNVLSDLQMAFVQISNRS